MKRDSQAPERALRELERQGLRRHRRTVEALLDDDSSVAVTVEGRRLLNFCGNDYLGLARHPDITAAMRAATALGAGSGASHLVSGHGLEHERLEAELAAFTRRERALLFSTGYMANLAVITTFATRGESVLLDRLSHASLIDAALLSGARLRRFAHADAGAAARALEADERVTVIATDGVFSMDGDLAPLRQLATSCREHEAWLVVDDAHGLGVVGETGRGTLEHFGLDAGAVPLLVGTLGKAFGTFGAFVAGSADAIELLLQRGRSYIYTTALPQPVAAATRAALAVAQREPWQHTRVHALTARFRARAAAAGVTLAASDTPIQPVILGDPAAALAASRALEDAGFWVAAIRPPTVPPGSSRLRVTLSAAHEESQVDALVDRLAAVVASARSAERGHTCTTEHSHGAT